LKAYVDSSVLLRVILGELGRLASWRQIDVAVSSELIKVECLRTIDRARSQLRLDDDGVARHRADALEVIDSMNLVPLAPAVLDRAADPFPTSIGSLDALHLASALLVRDDYEGLVFTTHDESLGIAAKAMGFRVEGL
jgi:predicted nucleic acid-binding protein